MTTPTKASHSRTYEIFARWSTMSYRHGAWVLLIALLGAIACGIYVSRNLGMNTDTTDMLSEHLPFRVNMRHYTETFPQDIDTMLLVVEAPTPEQARATTQRLAMRLKADTTNFQDVFAPTAEDFFARNGLLYESIPELVQITDRIVAAQPLIAQIADDPTLTAFADVLTLAVTEMTKGRNMELRPVMAGISATLDARIDGTPRAQSWQALFSGEAQKDKYQHIIVVKPKQDFSQLSPAEQSLNALHTIAKDIGVTEGGPIRLRITGEAALANEELKSSLSGMEYAGVITFVMVGMVLYFAMRTGGLIVNVLVCLTMGLLLTAAFATAVVGHLNLISIAFAVLYIGLGADFAIHFLLRYREVLEGGSPPDQAIQVSGGDAGAALTACTITNAIGFYAFMPTDYSGVAELGIISGTGMIISLLVTLTIGPALLRCLPQRRFRKSIPKSPVGKVLELSLRWHKATYAATAVASVAALAILPQVRFDYNLLNMQDPRGDAVQAFRELLAKAEDSPWHSIVLAKERTEAERLAENLAKLPEVSKVVTINDFVPSEQDEKLLLIEDMALTTGPITISTRAESAASDITARQRRALDKLATALDQFIKAHPNHAATEAAGKLKLSLANLLALVDKAGTDEQKGKLLSSVEEDLLLTLPIALQSLQLATEAAPFGEDDLPADLVNRWHSHTGEYRVAVYPAKDLNDNDELRRFVTAVQELAPNATGAPMVSLEAGEAVVKAFVQAFLLALVGIVVILLILLRSLKYTLLVLLPLLLSSLFTASFTVLLDVPFNFANIIALPLLLGLGIDSSLHMVHRSLNNEMVSEVLVHTSTARAIFYSALTALVDFASLMFSSHQGTASMGIMLTVGLTFTLVCTLAVLPVLLRAPAQGART